jgi:hypothetical protein
MVELGGNRIFRELLPIMAAAVQVDFTETDQLLIQLLASAVSVVVEMVTAGQQ